MSIFKFLLYFLLAFIVVRYLMRIMYPKQSRQPKNNSNMKSRGGSESLEKPKFTIEAESVDYEIIEEHKDQNEK